MCILISSVHLHIQQGRQCRVETLQGQAESRQRLCDFSTSSSPEKVEINKYSYGTS